MKANVLFVCVQNSCRSQMAEGFAKKWGGDKLEAWSAGSRPSGKVNLSAMSMMKEKGIDLSQHSSKGIEDLPSMRWDYVVTMGCGDACPFVSARAKLDWDIPDPVGLPLAEFRKVRDQIEQQVRAFIKSLPPV